MINSGICLDITGWGVGWEGGGSSKEEKSKKTRNLCDHTSFKSLSQCLCVKKLHLDLYKADRK